MPALRLSKSRYLLGLKCPKLLWWTAREPDAPELAADTALETVFARGSRVGELARAHVPGGVLVDLPYHDVKARVKATAKALAEGARVVYEASFFQDDIFVSVDILERRRGALVLTEVKATLDVKDEHLADVAVQLHVLRRAGLAVRRAEVMHLNRECRHPDLSNLFVREAVTARLRKHISEVPKRAPGMLSGLGGELPVVATGQHCHQPYECPFIERCWPELPAHHVSTLYRIRSSRVAQFVADGVNTLHQLPRTFPLSDAARRQVRSVKTGKTIVERGLRRALKSLKLPLAFLDFETVNPAIPAWPGCRPYDQVPVQFSCHVLSKDGLKHYQWIADGPEDPRAAFARALITACAKAKTVVAYNASFERRCVDALREVVPGLRRELGSLSERTLDLLAIVRDHVYHPDFGGSFSIKDVLPALIPTLGYDDLEIRDGGTASSALERLLLESDSFSPGESDALKNHLLRYCERDTQAMVRLHQRLSQLARIPSDPGTPRAQRDS
jgi:hypothetical protein